jgi:hypothetical protein
MFFSQRDPRWADVKLGTSGATIGGMGCLDTSAASILDGFGVQTDPGRLNRWLARNDGFIQGSLFVFAAIEALGVQLEAVIDCSRQPAPMDLVAQALDLGQGVVALVDFRPGGSVNQHWVRILAYDAEEEDCRIVDPWMPPGYELYWLMARYAVPAWDDPARAIFRLAMYSWPGRTSASAFGVRGVGRDFCQERLYRRPGAVRRLLGRMGLAR